jgi:HlyD family secretion protein
MSAVQSPAPVLAPERTSPPPQPAGPSPRRPWKWLILLVIAAVAAFGLYQWLVKPKPQQQAVAAPAARTTKVTTGTLERVARLAGQTSARNFANITAPLLRGPEMRGNLVILKLAGSGAFVKKGDVVLELDAQAVQDHLDDVNDTVEAAESDIRKRRAEQQIEWDALQQTLRVSKAELDKARLDYQAAEVRTDIEQQLLKLSLDEADAQYKEAQNDITFKKQAHAAELRILELTRDRHIRHRDRHVADLKRFTIHAPMDGLAVMQTVFRGGEMLQIQQGDQVFPGQQIMKIVQPKSMQVEATVNQSESSQFRINQKARITLDGFPGVEVPAQIYAIGALATRSWRDQYYIRNIPVRFTLHTQDPRIIPDLSASATVLLEKADNATIVPLGAVRTEKGKTVAYVKAGDGFEAHPIELGLRNDTHAAVVSGLRAGDEVRLN